MKKFLQYLFLLLLLAPAAVSSYANIYTVTSTTDNATSGTLRWAITQANAHAGKDSIYFNILPVVNYFEFSGVNSFAVIQLTDSLPAIRDALFMNGATQTNTNTATIAGKTVGVDAITQATFNCPDIYIVPSSSFPFPNGSGSGTANNQGNGLTIMNDDVTLQGLALSGFGNTNNTASNAQSSACINVYVSATEVYGTILIQDCFIGCDPMGALPSLAYRVTKGQGIVVMANRHNGTISHNYIAYAGVNAINLNCALNTPGSPSFPVIRGWTIQDNYMLHPSNNATLNAGSNVSDCASCLGTPRLTYQRNYMEDTYQTGLDLGHNSDTCLVFDNTVTGTTRVIGVLPQVGVRVTASCRAITLQKNLIYNNTSAQMTAGIYIDGLKTTISGASAYNTTDNFIQYNSIHDNNCSGIVLAVYNNNVATGVTSNNTISQNSTYKNAGLGIDIGYNTKTVVSGTTAVSINDNGDVDAGPNGTQNFPIIDSSQRVGLNLTVWGKSPAGATIEFFTSDGGINKFGTASGTLNYGEGKVYLATGVEGSAADLAGGTATYTDLDGNTANPAAANKFQFTFTLSAALAATINSTDSLTSTATLNSNTSEFGPQVIKFSVLSVNLKNLSGVYANKKTTLSWNAVCDENFNYFNVEYSTDGQSFTTVGKVNGNFNDNNPFDYSFDHYNPAGYNNYYRLRMVDKDGSFKYSNIVLITLKATTGITISPNPASDYLYINVSSLKEDVAQLRIVNAIGNVVFTKQEHLSTGTNSFTVKEISRFTTGVYVVQVVTGNDVKSQQLLIKRQ